MFIEVQHLYFFFVIIIKLSLLKKKMKQKRDISQPHMGWPLLIKKKLTLTLTLSMNSKRTMSKRACFCRLSNHNFAYLLSEWDTSHFLPRNCFHDSSVQFSCDRHFPFLTAGLASPIQC